MQPHAQNKPSLIFDALETISRLSSEPTTGGVRRRAPRGARESRVRQAAPTHGRGHPGEPEPEGWHGVVAAHHADHHGDQEHTVPPAPEQVHESLWQSLGFQGTVLCYPYILIKRECS